MTFATLKNNRQKDIGSLAAAATEAFEGKKNYSNDDFWKLAVDPKSKNGQATIRFLPSKDPENAPWIQYWDYFFKNPKNGQYYVEKSLSTLGQADPVGEYTSQLWNSGEEGKQFIRDNRMTRGLHYVTNILVIDHPLRPEDNGKVFKYRFGKKIFEKIKDAMSPEFDGDTPINPFDMWEGADFDLRRKQVKGWANYDSSKFNEPAPISNDDDELERIYNSMEDIQELISPDKFKSYDELKAKFNRVMGISANEPQAELRSAATSAESDYSSSESEEVETEVEDEASESSLSYFQKLANGG